MIRGSEIVIERIGVAVGKGEGLRELAVRSAREVLSSAAASPVAVIAATFSNPRRFPSLAAEVTAALGLPETTVAFDLQLACSAYPHALVVARQFAESAGGKVLVIDGDVQSPLVDADDPATGAIFSDAVTASLVSVGEGVSESDFLTAWDEALVCPAAGPVRMDGMKVFAFVATKVNRFLAAFTAAVGGAEKFDFFVPHQANPYMVRRLAKALGLSEKLLTLDEALKNPGSASVPMTLAAHWSELSGRRVLLAGFGAGFSAAAVVVRAADGGWNVGYGRERLRFAH